MDVFTELAARVVAAREWVRPGAPALDAEGVLCTVDHLDGDNVYVTYGPEVPYEYNYGENGYFHLTDLGQVGSAEPVDPWSVIND